MKLNIYIKKSIHLNVTVSKDDFVTELTLLNFDGNNFQNLSVSSPLPVTIFSPSGLRDKYSTRNECPDNVAILSTFGIFQTAT